MKGMMRCRIAKKFAIGSCMIVCIATQAAFADMANVPRNDYAAYLLRNKARDSQASHSAYDQYWAYREDRIQGRDDRMFEHKGRMRERGMMHREEMERFHDEMRKYTEKRRELFEEHSRRMRQIHEPADRETN